MAAVEVLGKLDAAEVAKHVAALLERLGDGDETVRKAAVEVLGKLNAAELAKHAAALLKRLDGDYGTHRKAALEVLGKLDAAELVNHVPALLKRLDGDDGSPRLAAVEMTIAVFSEPKRMVGGHFGFGLSSSGLRHPNRVHGASIAMDAIHG